MTDITICETCLATFAQDSAGDKECELCIRAGHAVRELKASRPEEYSLMMELAL